MSQIINRYVHLIKNTQSHNNIFPHGSIILANKCGHYLKNLLACFDPYNYSYNIKHDLTDFIPYGYRPCSKKLDSCSKFLQAKHKLFPVLLEENVT